jgi:hypothetical protein
VTIEPARLPPPRAAAVITSSRSPYGSSVLTGPNASTSCGAAADRSSQRNSIGDRKAPRSGSAPATSTRSGSPWTSFASADSRATAARTSSRWSSPATGPMPVSSRPGWPTTIPSSRAATAPDTAPASADGTNARRIAVHFCPALTVISVTSWST